MTYADDAERRDAYDRSDRSLRNLADVMAEQLRGADRGNPYQDLPDDLVLVIARRGADLNESRQYLLSATTLDEAARVLAALPQIRGGRR